MAATRHPIELWYEFASPYCYVSSNRILIFERTSAVQFLWRPFLLRSTFRKTGADKQPPSKQAYSRRDIERLCTEFGLELNWPSVYPRGSLLATRVAFWGMDAPWAPDFGRRVFRASLAKDIDIAAAGAVADILADIGLDARDVIEAATTREVKTGLADHVDLALERGVFGAPMFRVGDELFWGNDRLERAVEWALDWSNPQGQSGEGRDAAHG